MECSDEMYIVMIGHFKDIPNAVQKITDNIINPTVCLVATLNPRKQGFWGRLSGCTRTVWSPQNTMFSEPTISTRCSWTVNSKSFPKMITINTDSNHLPPPAICEKQRGRERNRPSSLTCIWKSTEFTFEFCLHHLPALWLWASFLSTLILVVLTGSPEALGEVTWIKVLLRS